MILSVLVADGVKTDVGEQISFIVSSKDEINLQSVKYSYTCSGSRVIETTDPVSYLVRLEVNKQCKRTLVSPNFVRV